MTLKAFTAIDILPYFLKWNPCPLFQKVVATTFAC